MNIFATGELLLPAGQLMVVNMSMPTLELLVQVLMHMLASAMMIACLSGRQMVIKALLVHMSWVWVLGMTHVAVTHSVILRNLHKHLAMPASGLKLNDLLQARKGQQQWLEQLHASLVQH